MGELPGKFRPDQGVDTEPIIEPSLNSILATIVAPSPFNLLLLAEQLEQNELRGYSQIRRDIAELTDFDPAEFPLAINDITGRLKTLHAHKIATQVKNIPNPRADRKGIGGRKEWKILPVAIGFPTERKKMYGAYAGSMLNWVSTYGTHYKTR